MILGPLKIDAMKLEWIARKIGCDTMPSGGWDVDIKGLAYDSRQVKPGSLFVAIAGRRHDGSAFIDEALNRGAVAVIGEQALALRHVPYLCVPDARIALADIACAYFENPSARLDVFGITGTNGKTTTAYMIRAILAAAERRPGLITTVCYEIGERIIPANRTTPEAPDLQGMLQKMERAGCDGVVMEVSSHALDQHRVRGIDFDVAVYTNLSRDHLDYHGTMDAYFDAKRRLFHTLGQGGKQALAVINADDPWGRKLIAEVVHGSASLITYGTAPGADVAAEDIRLDADGSRCTVKSPWGSFPLHLRSLGRFNISNALAAVAACGARGMAPDRMAPALEHMRNVPGRLQSVADGHPFNVFVDYAHTEDALSNVLEIVREITSGRILLVFGCGGDRDRSKRPAMGAVADQCADYTFITSDNPRREDAAAIAREIATGFKDASRYVVCLNRAEAIRDAITLAGVGDAVLIAGKGHENYQEFGHTVIPFDDADVARRLLGKK